MKLERSLNSIRLVGKSWAVCAKLHELAKSGLTLQQFLYHGYPRNPSLKLIK